MENLKCWKKYENNGELYYYLPDYKYKVKFFEIDQVSSRTKLDELESEISKLGVSSVSSVNDSAFSVITNELDESDLYELPYGCYSFKWGNGNKPSRLEKINTRDDVYFANQKLLNSVRVDIEKFIESKTIFEDLGVIHKRGYLLYGVPGTGKTSFVRHVISEVLPDEYHAIWIEGIPSFSFMQKFNSMPTLKVFVIEEITTFAQDGQAREMLEFLDGEYSPINSIIMATTNYPEELQQNLADRPSRFDIVIEIKESSEGEARMFFENFLHRKLLSEEVTLTGLSAAHIKEICLLSLMYQLPLQQCYEKVKERRDNFKKKFSNREEVGIRSSIPSRGNSIPQRD